MTRTKIFIGFLIAPLAPGLVILLYVLLYAGNEREGFLLFFFGSAIAYVVTLMLGVPSFLALRWLRIGSWTVYAAAGSLMGAATYFLCAPPQWVDAILANDLSKQGPHLFLLICTTAGFVAAIVFCFIARPDQNKEVEHH